MKRSCGKVILVEFPNKGKLLNLPFTYQNSPCIAGQYVRHGFFQISQSKSWQLLWGIWAGVRYMSPRGLLETEG